MIHTDENDSRYFESLDEARAEGYVPVKCYSVLEFYTLKGKTNPDVIAKVKEKASELKGQYAKYYKQESTQATLMTRARKQMGLPAKENSLELIKENLEPIRYLYHTVFDPQVKRYYMKLSRPYSVDALYFYRKDLTFSGEDIVIENLRKWVEDGNVTLLFTKKQIIDTTDILKRLWKAQFKTEGRVDYRLYIELLRLSINYEDYKDIGKELTGFKTVCYQYEMQIGDVWKRIKEKDVSK